MKPYPPPVMMLRWCISLWGRAWLFLHGCTTAAGTNVFGRPSLWHLRGKLTVGRRAMLMSLPILYPFGQEFRRCSFASRKGTEIRIGEDTLVIGTAFLCWKGITVGDRCLIAAGCRITDTHGHPVDLVRRRYVEDPDPRPVTIGDDVWLGAEVMVCKGVTIGNGSVIGAKSLVTSDIPPMTLAAGVPAKVIRALSPEEAGNGGGITDA